MLTSKELAELLAETPSCETSEIAENTTGRSAQPISRATNDANFAKLLTEAEPTSSQSSQTSQSGESVAKRINEPFLASSQTSQRDSGKALQATSCRSCGFPAPVDFRNICPSCGTTHPFAADDEISLTLTTAEWAISQAALTPEQTAARLADLRRKPEIARFWAKLFDPTVEPNLQPRERS